MTSNEYRCLNCGTTFQGNFCPECGQSSHTERFTTASALKGLMAALTGGENTFLPTAARLFYKPGKVAADYICGRRTRHFRPVQMLLFMVTIFVLVTYFVSPTFSALDIFKDESLASNIHSDSLSSALVYMGALLSDKVTFALLAALIFMLPFRLVFSRFKLERPDGSALPLNAAEHFYTLVYISCQTLILSLLMLPFSQIDAVAPLLRTINIFAPIVFAMWTYGQLYGKHRLGSILLTVAAIILTLVAISILTILIFGLFYGYDAVN